MWNILLKAVALFSKGAKATQVLKTIKKVEKLTGTIGKIKSATDLEGSLNKLLSKAGYKSPQDLFTQLLKNPKKFAENIGTLQGESRKAFSDFAKETSDEGKDASVLSSSWLTWGEYSPVSPDGQTGNLELTTTSGRSYTYYSVSRGIWETMKLAKGRNGTGAGSVFWAYYLRGYFRNPQLQKMALAFRLSNISPTFNDVKIMSEKASEVKSQVKKVMTAPSKIKNAKVGNIIKKTINKNINKKG